MVANSELLESRPPGPLVTKPPRPGNFRRRGRRGLDRKELRLRRRRNGPPASPSLVNSATPPRKSRRTPSLAAAVTIKPATASSSRKSRRTPPLAAAVTTKPTTPSPPAKSKLLSRRQQRLVARTGGPVTNVQPLQQLPVRTNDSIVMSPLKAIERWFFGPRTLPHQQQQTKATKLPPPPIHVPPPAATPLKSPTAPSPRNKSPRSLKRLSAAAEPPKTVKSLPPSPTKTPSLLPPSPAKTPKPTPPSPTKTPKPTPPSPTKTHKPTPPSPTKTAKPTLPSPTRRHNQTLPSPVKPLAPILGVSSQTLAPVPSSSISTSKPRDALAATASSSKTGQSQLSTLPPALPEPAKTHAIGRAEVKFGPHKVPATQNRYPVRSLFNPSVARVPKSWHDGPTRALIIGLSYKRNQTGNSPRPLNGTTDDARKMCQLLLDMGYNEDEFGIMLDDDPSCLTPSTADIKGAIKWLIDGATSKHRLFFYFAGHGSQVPDLDGDEADGKDEVLLMTDGGTISDDWLNAEMLQPLPEGCHFTAVFDCCHSGTALDLPHNYIKKGKKEPVSRSGSVVKRTRAHAVLFSACADVEVAWDAKFDDEYGTSNKGLFTEYFVLNLYNNMLDTNYPYSFEQLLADTSKDVKAWCKRNASRLPGGRKNQTPQMSSGKPLDVHAPALM